MTTQKIFLAFELTAEYKGEPETHCKPFATLKAAQAYLTASIEEFAFGESDLISPTTWTKEGNRWIAENELLEGSDTSYDYYIEQHKLGK